MAKSSAAAEAVPAPSIEMLSLSQIEESAFNPRKTFDGIEELAEDLKRRGVLQPVLVRPAAGKYELVFGARRYRAAKLAKLGAIPAMIRTLDDAEALEIAIIENSKRTDVHPLEEADGYRELHEKHGYDVDTIAAKVGKSKGFVYGRLKLCELCDEARKAFLESRISASVATDLIARLPKEHQVQALDQVAGSDQMEPLSFREAADFVRRQFLQRLAEAPFDTKSAELVPEAGACTTCPKRTGANPDLFEGISEEDTCTDSSCFKVKVAAGNVLRLQEAEKKGAKVLSEAQAKKALQYGSGFVKLDDKCHEDPKGHAWSELLKKEEDLERFVAVDHNGDVRELVRAKDARDALKEAGKDWAKKIYVPADREKHQERHDRDVQKDAAAHQLRTKVAHRALLLLGDKVAKAKTDVKFWRLIAELVLKEAAYGDAPLNLAEAYGAAEKQLAGYAKEIEKGLPKAKEGELRALVVQLLVASEIGYGSVHGEELKRACDFFKIDLKAIEKNVKAAPPAPVEKKGKGAK